MMQVLLYWLNSKGVLACDLSKKEVCDHKYVAIFSKKRGSQCLHKKQVYGGRPPYIMAFVTCRAWSDFEIPGDPLTSQFHHQELNIG